VVPHRCQAVCRHHATGSSSTLLQPALCTHNLAPFTRQAHSASSSRTFK
jgi:hypothetical protein